MESLGEILVDWVSQTVQLALDALDEPQTPEAFQQQEKRRQEITNRLLWESYDACGPENKAKIVARRTIEWAFNHLHPLDGLPAEPAA